MLSFLNKTLSKYFFCTFHERQRGSKCETHKAIMLRNIKREKSGLSLVYMYDRFMPSHHNYLFNKKIWGIQGGLRGDTITITIESFLNQVLTIVEKEKRKVIWTRCRVVEHTMKNLTVRTKDGCSIYKKHLCHDNFYDTYILGLFLW